MRTWNSKYFGKSGCSKLRRSFGVKLSDLKNIFIGKFGARGFFATRLNRLNELTPLRTFHVGISSLFHFVINIVSVCAEKKVLRIHAKSVVTPMKDLNSFRNFSNKIGIGKSVGIPLFFEKEKRAVSTPELGSRPQPTFTKMGRMLRNWTVLINLFGKSLFSLKLNQVGFGI